MSLGTLLVEDNKQRLDVTRVWLEGGKILYRAEARLVDWFHLFPNQYRTLFGSDGLPCWVSQFSPHADDEWLKPDTNLGVTVDLVLTEVHHRECV